MKSFFYVCPSVFRKQYWGGWSSVSGIFFKKIWNRGFFAPTWFTARLPEMLFAVQTIAAMVTGLGSRSDPRKAHLQSKPFWLTVAAWRKAGRLSKLDDSLVERGVGRWQFHMLSCRHHLVSRCIQLWSPVFKTNEVELEQMMGGHLLALRSTLGMIWGARGSVTEEEAKVMSA